MPRPPTGSHIVCVLFGTGRLAIDLFHSSAPFEVNVVPSSEWNGIFGFLDIVLSAGDYEERCECCFDALTEVRLVSLSPLSFTSLSIR